MEVEWGYMDYFGTRFQVVFASVDFSPHYHENVPWVSSKAEADAKGIDEENVLITMIIEGRADNDLAPKLYSAPALTPREIFLLLDDSMLYVSDSAKSQEEEEEEIDNLIKLGFVQIFNATYRDKLVIPLERKARRFLGLDLLKIKSSLVKNLLEPRLYKLDEHNRKDVNPFADTQFSVGKYITESVLLKYSVNFKENIDISKLYYEHKLGFEWKIIRSLNFEWMYYPLYVDEYSQPYLSEQRYKLEWKQKFSF